MGQYYENYYVQYMSARRSNLDFFNYIEGSPYEIPDFSDALLFLKGTSDPVAGKFRYNNLFDEMEMQVENVHEYLIIKEKDKIDKVYFNHMNLTLRYLSYNEKNQIKKGFFIQLTEDECCLFLKQPREYKPEKEPTGYQDLVPPSIIKNSDLFYVQFGSSPLELIPQSSKKMTALFKENGYDISQLTGKKKINYNQQTMMEIVSYCNQ